MVTVKITILSVSDALKGGLHILKNLSQPVFTYKCTKRLKTFQITRITSQQ